MSVVRPRTVVCARAAVAILAGGIAAALVAGGPMASADAAGSAPERLVPACTPQLIHSLRPGREMDARSIGEGLAPNLDHTDADGNARPATSARVTWSARAVVDEPARETGALPKIGGRLNLEIETATGDELGFTATCIAAAGGFAFGLVVYANGIVRGWPGSEAQRALVHFEAYTDGTAYLALVAGWDCELNHDARVVTEEPYIIGASQLSGLPSQFVFAETDCARRFGEPFPPSRAPGLIGP